MFLALYLQGVEPASTTLQSSPKLEAALQSALASQPELLERPKLTTRILRLTKLTAQNLATPLLLLDRPLGFAALSIAIVLLAINWIRCLLASVGIGRAYPPGAEFFLSMATICLGISIASWLGRFLAIDPATSRYQTTVVLFWLSVLSLFTQNLLTTHRPWVRVSGLSIALAIVVLVFRGYSPDALPRIVGVSEAAKVRQSLASLGWLPKRLPFFISYPGRQEVYKEHFEFLSQYKPFTLPQLSLDEREHTTEDGCTGIEWEIVGRRKHSEIRKIRLRGELDHAWWKRIYILDGEQVVGQLYNVYRDPGISTQLLYGSGEWTGFLKTQSQVSRLSLYFPAGLGASRLCDLGKPS